MGICKGSGSKRILRWEVCVIDGLFNVAPKRVVSLCRSSYLLTLRRCNSYNIVVLGTLLYAASRSVMLFSG